MSSRPPGLDDLRRLERRLDRVSAFVPAGVGGLFLVLGLVVSGRALAFTLASHTAEGRVVDVDSVRDDSEPSRVQLLHYPVVEFTDDAGQPHRFRGDVSRGRGSGPFRGSDWTVGEAVRVRYDPDHPERARLGGSWNLLPHLFLVFGVIAVWLAARIRREGRT